MMTYEYACTACGRVTAAKRRVSERDHAPACSHCGQRTKRIFPPRGVQVRYPYAWRYGNRSDTYHLPTTDEEKEIWRKYG